MAVRRLARVSCLMSCLISMIAWGKAYVRALYELRYMLGSFV